MEKPTAIDMTSLSPEQLPSAEVTPEQLDEGSSLWSDAWHRLRRNRLAVFGATILVLIISSCVIGPIVSPYAYEE